ncbi:MAG: hypothetical protein QM727_07405 [Niabella sp.]
MTENKFHCSPVCDTALSIFISPQYASSMHNIMMKVATLYRVDFTGGKNVLIECFAGIIHCFWQECLSENYNLTV